MLLPPSLGKIRAEARADVLADWLGGRLQTPIAVSVAGSYDELAVAIVDARVDLAWAPPSVCAQIADRVRAIFKAVRGGRSSYCSAIVARPDGPKDVAGLRGKRAAWVDERSVGGYLLARAHLKRAGIDPQRDLRDCRFYGSYGDALRAVLARQADFAAAFSASPDDDQTRLRLHELVGAAADELAIVAHTDDAPADGLVVTPRAETRFPDIVARLAPLVDGSGGYTFLLSLLEAERLEPAKAGDYASLLE